MLLAYGVYSLTGMYGHVPRDKATRLIKDAACMGVQGYDTADVYGRGLGEELIREAYPHGHPLVMTKVGYDIYTLGRPTGRYDYDYLVKAARRSVERLGFKPVYLIQVHNPPLSALQGRDIYRAMRTWKEEGLTLHTGIALGPEVDVQPHAREAMTHDEVEYLQFVYNMLEQEPGYTIASEAKSQGVRIIARVPHAGGVLDESYKPGDEPRDHRVLRRKGWYEWAWKLYTRIKPLLEEIPGTPGQKALAYIRDTISPDHTVIIATSSERIADYTGFTRVPRLPARILEEIRNLYMEALPENPEKPRLH